MSEQRESLISDSKNSTLLPKIHIQQQLRLFRRILFLILFLAAVMLTIALTGYMDDEVLGSGTVEGIREYELKTQVTAKAVGIYRQAGDFASAGAKLVQLDSRDLEEEIRTTENKIKELEIAIEVKKNEYEILKKDPLPTYYRHTELELKEAEERYRRSVIDLEAYTRLYDQKAISKHEFIQREMEHISCRMELERLKKDEKTVKAGLANDILVKAENELRQMQQQLAAAQEKLAMEKHHLDDYVLRAPDAGIVTDIPPRPGNYYTTGEVLVRFSANRHKKVVAMVSENQVYKVKPGQKARISCSQYNYLDYGYFYGEVQYVYQLPVEVEGQKYYPVKLVLISEPYPLKFGSSCKITIVTGRERILFALLGIKSQDYLTRKAQGMLRKQEEGKFQSIQETK